MKMIYKVSVERCIACGKCELACAFAHGSEGRPAATRINIGSLENNSKVGFCSEYCLQMAKCIYTDILKESCIPR